MIVEFTLPYPPSVNHYLARTRRGVRTTEQTRRFKQECAGLLMWSPKERFCGAVRVEVMANPPDNSRRDLDNLLKVTLDAMTHAGVWKDDSQIDMLTIQRGPIVPGGVLFVRVTGM
ncbi:MAG TPA: RusA family crossover junction endodeoxyribonuclease [Nitrospira sp.]|jgi:crossover junction endodeoxyribonuclease RusA|uniref:RusA family crossover junction endodeoxyribonuclease n=1 Tax=Accumulibacter sp. TaxID=2053492 RepID=UPI00258F4F4E|nr:RusA family crossover junction endodeoxyribonuclease [Accumulibacter sp.]MCM8579153.1 RusA family crossover junction endodeoxyribonuclease [Accumulibacter sp.]HMW57759.1 RusA family crossover junction endodeoxyribonuclease [Accumulibacter sp.]HMX92679.1 RusA family crossover junction endodeoxyribonuclease [Nitrospira sp.]HNO73649.1 RusA family crossover junction endodeoxyribonuclease [Accumulibacter sp.]